MVDRKKPGPAERFHANTLQLCEVISEIIKIATQKGYKSEISPFMIEMGKGYISGIEPNTMITGFIEHSVTYWDSIHARDEKFILENAEVLFQEVPKDYVREFTRFYGIKDIVTDSIRTEIWEVIHAMVKISIRHIHETRAPTPNAAGVKKYTKEYFPSVKVSEQIKKWEIRL